MNPPWPVVPRETKLTMPAIPMPSTAPNPALRINIAPAQSHPSAEAAAADNEARVVAANALRMAAQPIPSERKPVLPPQPGASIMSPQTPIPVPMPVQVPLPARSQYDDDAELTQAQREEIWQMLLLPSDRKAGGRNGKRSAPDLQYSKARHAASEKKRREELNVLFDHIKQKVPSSANAEESNRLTKLDILSQTEDYIKRLENLAYGLLQENRSMKAAMFGGPRPSKEQLW